MQRVWNHLMLPCTALPGEVRLRALLGNSSAKYEPGYVGLPNIWEIRPVRLANLICHLQSQLKHQNTMVELYTHWILK